MAPIPEEYLPEPFQPIITLKDGTVINGSGALNELTDDLFLWPDNGLTMVDAITIFTDISKTDHIKADYSKIESNEFDGYTKLVGVAIDRIDKMTVRLRKP